MNVWSWLDANAGAFQSLFALVGAVLTVVTITVLIVTWQAVKVQADASRALTKVAEEQTNAARDAAEATKRQADLLASQIELSTAPLLISEPDPKNVYPSRIVVNRGLGMAFQVHYWQGTHETKNQGVNPISFTQPSTLAPGSQAELRIPGDWESWTISYKGSDR